MKKLLVGLLALGSISAYSSTGCKYHVDGVSTLKRGRLIQVEESLRSIKRNRKNTQKSIKLIETEMKSKGYTKSSQASADYLMKFKTIIYVGKFNGLENDFFGDNYAVIKMARSGDGKLIYKDNISDVSGVVGSIGKRAKSRILLRKILENVPECSQL